MLGSCYCLESSVVGCLLCHAGCSTDKLASSLAFHPPSPPSYVLRTAPDGTRVAAFDPLSDDPRLSQDWGASLRSCEVDEVTTRRGNTVCVLRMRRPGRDAYGTKATIVVSHGNALDAALFIPFATHIATQLDANVSVYDYSGYGASSGRPRVEDCKADIEAVVTHHVDVLGCDPGRIVLYGQSIGSGPTCHYAALAGNNQSQIPRRSPVESTQLDEGRQDRAQSRRGGAHLAHHVRPQRHLTAGGHRRDVHTRLRVQAVRRV